MNKKEKEEEIGSGIVRDQEGKGNELRKSNPGRESTNGV